MRNFLAENRTFLREARDSFHTTGAVLPSSRWLAGSLSRYVVDDGRPKKILEAGPGTGAVTQAVVRRMGPSDELLLVEANAKFVDALERRFRDDPRLQPAADRASIVNALVEEIEGQERFDVIISGLPLNNFSDAQVTDILGAFARLIRPGGMLSFFEYVAVRGARRLVTAPADRTRLRNVGRVLGDWLRRHEARRDCVWRNVPPAWVHHLKFDASTVSTHGPHAG